MIGMYHASLRFGWFHNITKQLHDGVLPKKEVAIKKL